MPQMKALRIGAAVGAFLLFTKMTFAAEPPAAQKNPRALPTVAREFKLDFDGMVERRVIRVLVPYSRTLYFNDKGRERGFVADAVRDFERYINQKYQKQLGNRPITVVHLSDHALQAAAACGRRARGHRGCRPDGHRGE